MAYLVIFITVFLEGPVATLAAAAFTVSSPSLAILPVFLTAMSANLLSDVCWYLLGAAGKHGKVLQRIPWLRHQEGLTDRASLEIQRSGIKVFVLTKFALGMGTIPLLIAAGMLHINRTRLLAAALCTEIFWTGTLILVGSALGPNPDSVQSIIQHNTIYAAGLILFLALIYICRRESTRKNTSHK